MPAQEERPGAGLPGAAHTPILGQGGQLPAGPGDNDTFCPLCRFARAWSSLRQPLWRRGSARLPLFPSRTAVPLPPTSVESAAAKPQRGRAAVQQWAGRGEPEHVPLGFLGTFVPAGRVARSNPVRCCRSSVHQFEATSAGRPGGPTARDQRKQLPLLMEHRYDSPHRRLPTPAGASTRGLRAACRRAVHRCRQHIGAVRPALSSSPRPNGSRRRAPCRRVRARRAARAAPAPTPLPREPRLPASGRIRRMTLRLPMLPMNARGYQR